MLNLRYIVRCHPRRQGFVEYLKERLPATTLYSSDDYGRGHRPNFLNALTLAGSAPALHFEDDILLAENFLERAHAAIAERPETVIQFFSMRKADLETGSRLESGRTFMMTQCFYLPAGHSAALHAHYPHWKDAEKHVSAVDIFTADFLKSRKEKYWIHVPSLVQHRQTVSIIDKRRSQFRQSLTFEDIQ